MTTQHNPNPDLGSILRSAPVPPVRRVLAAMHLRPDLAAPSLRTLAHHLDRSPQQVVEVLHGRRPSPPLWAAIAQFLGVSIADLGGPEMVEGGSASSGQAGCSALSS